MFGFRAGWLSGCLAFLFFVFFSGSVCMYRCSCAGNAFFLLEQSVSLRLVTSPIVWYWWWACCFTSNQSYKKNCSFYTRFFFKALDICEVILSYDGHTAAFLSVYRPPPCRQNKLTSAMFLEQFSDLLQSYRGFPTRMEHLCFLYFREKRI